MNGGSSARRRLCRVEIDSHTTMAFWAKEHAPRLLAAILILAALGYLVYTAGGW